MKGDVNKVNLTSSDRISVEIKALADLFLTSIEKIERLQSKLEELCKECVNYRKQLVFVRDTELPVELRKEFPKLRSLLSLKVSSALEKLIMRVDKTLDEWKQLNEAVNRHVEQLQSLLNSVLTSVWSSEAAAVEQDVADSFQNLSITPSNSFDDPDLLFKSTSTSFSSVEWYQHFYSLKSSLFRDYVLCKSVLHRVLHQNIDCEILEALPPKLDCLKYLMRIQVFFEKYREFNS